MPHRRQGTEESRGCRQDMRLPLHDGSTVRMERMLCADLTLITFAQ